jgi:hypothetical protein
VRQLCKRLNPTIHSIPNNSYYFDDPELLRILLDIRGGIATTNKLEQNSRPVDSAGVLQYLTSLHSKAPPGSFNGRFGL